MIIMEIVRGYPNYIGYKCPYCDSEEVAYGKDAVCTHCGKFNINVKGLWKYVNKRFDFYLRKEV